MSLTNNLIVLLFLLCSPSYAQEVLTLDKAIETVLKNNYGIIIAGNDAQVLKNDHSPGNAGFLPQLNVSAGGTFSNNNTLQQYSSGQEVNKNNVASNNLNAGMGFTWTLFDGLKMFATNARLKSLAEQGELNLKLTMEDAIYRVMSAYYDIVRLQQLIVSSGEILDIYKEREHITQVKFDIGSGSKLELLQTRVDKNSVRAALLRNTQSLSEAKANLNLLLARSAETIFDIQDSLTLSGNYRMEDLMKSVFSRNYSLLFAGKNTDISRYSVQEYQSQRLPRLGINATYNFIRNENKAGFSLLNRNLGYSAGFNITWNLFNGFNTGRQVKNARLDWSSAKSQYEYTKSQTGNGLYNAWKSYENAKELLNLEEENITLAKENTDIALHRFKLGGSGILELREAQRSYEEAITRVITARYQARMAEVMLMKLNGDLVK